MKTMMVPTKLCGGRQNKSACVHHQVHQVLLVKMEEEGPQGKKEKKVIMELMVPEALQELMEVLDLEEFQETMGFQGPEETLG